MLEAGFYSARLGICRLMHSHRVQDTLQHQWPFLTLVPSWLFTIDHQLQSSDLTASSVMVFENDESKMTNLTFLEIFRTWMMRFSQTVSHYCSQSQVCDTVSSSPDQGALSPVSSLTETASLCPGHSPPPAVLILSWISLLTQARLVFLSLTSPRQHVTLELKLLHRKKYLN